MFITGLRDVFLQNDSRERFADNISSQALRFLLCFGFKTRHVVFRHFLVERSL
jgi:hypothetical protein